MGWWRRAGARCLAGASEWEMGPTINAAGTEVE